MKVVVATSQFAVSDDVKRNLRGILRQMEEAKDGGARVIHFCEGALSAYVPHDRESFAGYDWDALREASEEVAAHAKKLRLWVVLGSTHRLTGRRKPHNSVYVIDDRGRLVDRYDKRFCAGDRTGKTGELAHFTPGSRRCVFDIAGVRCGILICHEYRYPELHREYKKAGVQLIFHSYHAGNMRPDAYAEMQAQVGAENHAHNPGTTLPEITMPASMHAVAASSHVWISCANSSARESCFPAFAIRPDGVVVGKLKRNRAGVLLTSVDPRAKLYDSTEAWRNRAMGSRFHSGRTVEDPRSSDRRSF